MTALVFVVALSVAAAPNSVGPGFARWIDGTTSTEPETQVQRIDDDSFVIRQSVKTNFEAPFLYLLFGTDRALLIDSGAGGLKIRPTVDRVIRDWPNTTGRFDLGHRVLDIVPTPGHEPAHIMIYDARTRLIFSGDMLYPGRLYVPSDRFDVFHASAVRLAGFARTHPVRALLGAHIEMTTTPGKDYQMEAASHPSEHGLALPPSAIEELETATAKAKSPPEIDRHPDFIVYPVAPKPV